MATSRAAPRTPTIPATMKAAALDRFGPPSVLRLHTLPVPKPGPGQVLIALHAAGVGSWDASIRDGSWQPNGRPKFPLVPGTDGAGTVVAKGPRVRRFRVGDRVYANEFGCYAEYVAAKVDDVGRVPPRLDLRQAGAAATTGLTALQGIDALRLRRGQTVLIYGASGAVGTLAVQFAKRKHARLVATASGRDAMALVRRLGADAVIDARRDDAIERLRKLAPDGLDAVLVLAGSDTLEGCLDLVRAGGAGRVSQRRRARASTTPENTPDRVQRRGRSPGIRAAGARRGRGSAPRADRGRLSARAGGEGPRAT